LLRPLGDENMGTYVFQAQPQVVACQLSINTDPFTFSGTMSRFRDGGHAFLLLQGKNRDAGFDGQVFVTRVFAFDPNNPSWAPPIRDAQGNLVDQASTAKSVTVTPAAPLPAIDMRETQNLQRRGAGHVLGRTEARRA